MAILILPLLVILAIALVLIVLKHRIEADAGTAPRPFYARKPMSPPEQVLYYRLVAALPECIVLAQVQLSRALGVHKGFRFHTWHSRINRMSLDFLVCQKDATIIAAIELDDASRDRAERMAADAQKDKALHAAGIALLRWNVDHLPDAPSIRQTFARQTSPSPAPN